MINHATPIACDSVISSHGALLQSMAMDMPPVVIEPTSPRDAKYVNVTVHVSAEVIAPDVARRKASGWLVDHVGNLLHAEQPQLLVGERLLWQMQVALTSPRVGVIGYIGPIQLDATSGEIINSEETAAKLTRHVATLAQRPPSPSN